MLLARALRKGLRKAGLFAGRAAEFASDPLAQAKVHVQVRARVCRIIGLGIIRVDGEATALGGIHHHPAGILGHAG